MDNFDVFASTNISLLSNPFGATRRYRFLT